MEESVRNFLTLFGENRHLQTLILIALTLLAAKMVDLLVTRGLASLARKTPSEIDDALIEYLHRPLFLTVGLIGVGLALKIERIPEPFEGMLFAVLKTLAILIWVVLGVRVATLVFNWMARHPSRFTLVQSDTLPVFEILSKVVLFGGAVYFMLLAWKIDPTAWMTSAGIIGIAVGFAAKDTLANLFAGVFILADAPYKVGDFIQLDGQRGQVTRIGLRSTRILTRDDVEITVPNAMIANSRIINESGGPSVKNRLRVPVGVAYGSDIDKVRAVLQEIADTNTHVCVDPEPRVRFRGFGDSSLNFELLCWIQDPVQRGLVLDDLNSLIYKAFARERIEIPFPKRDLYVRHLPAPPQTPPTVRDEDTS